MKFGKYFEYNGQSTEQFGLILGSFEKNPDMATGTSRSTIKGERTKFRKRANHLGTSYNEDLSFDVTLVKDPCKYSYDQRKMQFKRSEVNEIMRWLTSPNYPKLFRSYDFDEKLLDEEIEYFGVFTDNEFCTVNGVYGIKFTFECDSPYGYTPEYERAYSSTTLQPIEFEINNTSAETEDYIYPTLEITAKSKTDFTINNLTENKSVTYKNLQKGERLSIDNERCIIKDLDNEEFIGLDVLELKDIDQIYWFRLVDGFNQISISGDVDIKMKYRELRKVGEY